MRTSTDPLQFVSTLQVGRDQIRSACANGRFGGVATKSADGRGQTQLAHAIDHASGALDFLDMHPAGKGADWVDALSFDRLY
jgi:hypothetical protein